MLHYLNCRKLKYIHDEPYTLVDFKRRTIKLKKNDILILDDGEMYRSLKCKKRLFVELDMKFKENKETKAETKKKKDDSLFLAQKQQADDKPKSSEENGKKESKEEKETLESKEQKPSTATEETEEVSKEKEC